MTDPYQLSAVQARGLIGSRRLSPVDLVRSCIARIEEQNPAVNAFVSTCFDQALEEADAKARGITTGQRLPPLYGLPVGVKDLNDTQGLRTTYGSSLYANHIPARDDLVVAGLRRAGAIVIGKTNTSEFGAGANTTNTLFGPTLNPYDHRLTAGGSSGGSAAALAEYMVPLAQGSDTGGSVRTPAAFCGVVGLRPSPGLVPSDRRVHGWSLFGVQGPMARTVDDAALMLSAMAGFDEADPLSGPADPASFRALETIDPATLRVVVTEDLGVAPVDQAIRRVFRDRVERLSRYLGDIEERSPSFDRLHRAYWVLRSKYYLSNHTERYEKYGDKLSPNVRKSYEDGLALTAAEIAWAEAAHTRFYRDFQAYLGDADVLVCPATSVSPFPIALNHPPAIDGAALENYIHWIAITYATSLTGNPSIVVPCGYDHVGMPFSLQLVGRYRGDRRLLEIARAIETITADDQQLRHKPAP